MKTLLVGPRLADFDPGYNTSILRALQALGHETRLRSFFVPTPPGVVNRLRIDGGMALGYRRHFDAHFQAFNAALLAEFESFRPDLVLVIRGNAVDAETLERMTGAVRALWIHDRVVRCGLTSAQLHSYQHRFVFEGSDVQWFEDNERLLATFLPMGYDPAVYRPLSDVRPDLDLCFIGAYYPERRELLERLARDFKRRRLRFYGRNVRYREPRTWLKALGYFAAHGLTFINSSLNAPEINRLYARSRLCLNIHHEQSQLGCNPRVFEIMGAGGFQLVDAIPFVRDHLCGIVATYTNYDELSGAIETYLRDDKPRRELAEEGRQFALGQHTFEHRVRKILEQTGFMDGRQG